MRKIVKIKYVYNFQQFETVRYFAKNIFAGKFTLNDADKDQIVMYLL